MAPRVELEVLEHAELPLDEIGIAITRQSAWRAAGISAESRPRIIAEAVEDRTGKPTHEFAGLAFDSATNQGWEIRGDVNYLDSINMVPTAATPLPSQEELLEAAQILRADDAFARIAEEGVVIYQPMPPLADVEQLDGTAIRRITLVSGGRREGRSTISSRLTSLVERSTGIPPECTRLPTTTVNVDFLIRSARTRMPAVPDASGSE